MKIPVVYIAGSFTAATPWLVEQNVRRAEEAGVAVALLGASPLIPHANTRYFQGIQTPKFWYAATMALLEKSDAVMTVEGWTRSEGACKEVQRAAELGIPVFHGDLKALQDWMDRR